MLGCDPSEAEDLLQETFLCLARAQLPDRGTAALRGWLRQTARHTFLASRRRARREPVVSSDVDAAVDDYERDDEGASYREALQACLEGLSVRERDLLEQRAHGASRAQLAAAAGLAPEGFKSLLRRITTRLRNCVRTRIDHESTAKQS